ncbi:fructokinase [Mesorhizobium sp. J18]|uniref:carbohydrate kinase family protein n=1 Tax=Mesorhizobium sp. J18 TaxID=935263 RepID=UPI0011990454|nr:carbohydrate kinase [Mesorhizobium sp. J18]TWG94748.1 fructokinase [Mesorhizobium sp. J18]
MILCCGEALIDMLPQTTAEGVPAFVPYPGGAVFNSAIALGRLGVATGFFSGLSEDLFGKQLQAALAASHVDIRYAKISNRPTTLAFVSLAGGQASYVFYDENTAGRMITAGDLPDIGNDVDCLLFGGISLIPEPCGSAYESLMAREHKRRAIMFDPNIRPAFIPDRQAHEARMRRMVAMADIVKISEDDLVWFGETGPQEEIARRWLELGPRLMVITRGGDGATAFLHGGPTVHVPARPVQVADTVGAGDTFNAGLLAALHERGLLSKQGLAELDESEVRDALSFAIGVAAVTVTRAGANPPWLHELG